MDNMDPVFEILLGLANALSSAVFAFLSTPPDLPIAVKIETLSSSTPQHISFVFVMFHQSTSLLHDLQILSTVGVAVMLMQLVVYFIYYIFQPQAQHLQLQLQPQPPSHRSSQSHSPSPSSSTPLTCQTMALISRFYSHPRCRHVDHHSLDKL